VRIQDYKEVKMDRETAEKSFDEFDMDKSGKVDAKELDLVVRACYKYMGEPCDDAKVAAEVKSMVDVIDTSKDGKISRDEFVKFMTSP
jgi:Ca2+-binding EF-hand superfamily protein